MSCRRVDPCVSEAHCGILVFMNMLSHWGGGGALGTLDPRGKINKYVCFAQIQ